MENPNYIGNYEHALRDLADHALENARKFRHDMIAGPATRQAEAWEEVARIIRNAAVAIHTVVG